MSYLCVVEIVFVCLSVYPLCTAIEYNISGDITLRVDNDSDSTTVICRKRRLDDQVLTQNLSMIRSAICTLLDCPLPTNSYAESLVALNIDVTGIKELHLMFSSSSRQLAGKHLMGLPNLVTLQLGFPQNTEELRATPTFDFLEPLNNLRNLYLINGDLGTLPNSTRVRTVELWYGASYETWGGCQELQTLKFQNWDINKVPKRWLAHCPQLKLVHMEGMADLSPKALRDALMGAQNLQYLHVRNCRLEEISKQLNFLGDAVNLKTLDLSNNRLHTFYINPLPALTDVLLADNNMNRDVVLSVLANQKKLDLLDVSSNKGINLCVDNAPWERKEKVVIKHSKLKRLFMGNTGTTELCFDRLQALQYLDISRTKITQLQFEGIPVSRAPLTVDLYLNDAPLHAVRFSERDYKMLLNNSIYFKMINSTDEFQPSTVIVNGPTRLDCDCRHGWLARALREKLRLSFRDIKCKDESETLIDKAPKVWLNCNKEKCGGTCTCRRYWSNNAVDADCRRADLKTVPHIPNIRTLVAPSNHIDVINSTDLPESLVRLDLTGNKISRLDASAVDALFNVSKRLMRFAGNPIVCSCENESFLKMLQLHKDQVDDYNSIKCAEDNKPLSEVIVSDLCKSKSQLAVTVAVGGCIALVALMALCAALYYRYGRELRVFLYARGCCLWCVREEELDLDRQYDAFVSFSHGDEQYVIEELVPGLEQAPHNFKLCIHYRDWMPGEFIPLQITRSVEQSRRTVIVMSSNYIASTWGLLEFRAAHEDTLSSGRPRIIVVLLEDVVNDEALDPELRNYLKNNTYVKVRDPWFWEKLIYAMPHHSRSETIDSASVPTNRGSNISMNPLQQYMVTEQ